MYCGYKRSHADLTDDYAAIPYEMKKVANYFNQEALREVDKNDFYLNLPKIREILGDRAFFVQCIYLRKINV